MSTVLPQHLVGRVVDGRYRLIEVIGAGGSSTVFRALHERMPKQFAVKVLHRHHANDTEQVRRLADEVRAIAVLEHPNIVEVVDYAEDSSAGWFIVMPLLAGEPLSSRQQRLRTLPAVDLHHVVVQSAGALDAAHRAGVVHRDVKPENLFLQSDPAADCGFSVRVLDFGIAKFRAAGDGIGDGARAIACNIGSCGAGHARFHESRTGVGPGSRRPHRHLRTRARDVRMPDGRTDLRRR
jgi:serine/threonine-protein kinase